MRSRQPRQRAAWHTHHHTVRHAARHVPATGFKPKQNSHVKPGDEQHEMPRSKLTRAALFGLEYDSYSGPGDPSCVGPGVGGEIVYTFSIDTVCNAINRRLQAAANDQQHMTNTDAPTNPNPANPANQPTQPTQPTNPNQTTKPNNQPNTPVQPANLHNIQLAK